VLDPTRTDALYRDLIRRRVLFALEHPLPGYFYSGPHDFILQEGRWYEPGPFPRGIPRGPARMCFGNAITLAARLGLRYIEGYALHGRQVLHHAWNTDSSHRLIDCTWRNQGLAYLGVHFSVERADDATWNGDASVLDDHKRGWPLLCAPWEGEPPGLEWPFSPRLAAARMAQAKSTVAQNSANQ
jgi:hypothetical protein